MTEIILTLGQAFEIAYQMVLESSDKYSKELTKQIKINTNINNNNSINYNNPQIINKKNNNKFNDILSQSDDKQKKINEKCVEINSKPNNTYITTINITSSSEQKINSNKKINNNSLNDKQLTKNGK